MTSHLDETASLPLASDTRTLFCGVHSTIVSSSLELSHGCSVLYPVCRWIVFHSCVRKQSMTWRWYEPFSPAPSPLLALLIHRRPRRWHVQILFVCVDIWPSDAHCCNMGTAIKHPVPDRVIPSFVIFDIRALLTLSPERQSACISKITKWWLNPVWHKLLYSCTHMATVAVRGPINHRMSRVTTFTFQQFQLTFARIVPGLICRYFWL